jgi:hypothetical protein
MKSCARFQKALESEVLLTEHTQTSQELEDDLDEELQLSKQESGRLRKTVQKLERETEKRREELAAMKTDRDAAYRKEDAAQERIEELEAAALEARRAKRMLEQLNDGTAVDLTALPTRPQTSSDGCGSWTRAWRRSRRSWKLQVVKFARRTPDPRPQWRSACFCKKKSRTWNASCALSRTRSAPFFYCVV